MEKTDKVYADLFTDWETPRVDTMQPDFYAWERMNYIIVHISLSPAT